MNLQKHLVVLGTVTAIAVASGAAIAGNTNSMYRSLDDGTVTDVPLGGPGDEAEIVVRSCGGNCRSADVSGMMMNSGFDVESTTQTFVEESSPAIAADLQQRDLNQIVTPPVASLTPATLAGTVLRTNPDLGSTNNFPTTPSSASNAMTESVSFRTTETAAVNVGIQAVPEPDGILLLAVGALALGLIRRRR